MDEQRQLSPIQERVRVSCAGLCRIRDEQGRYLLALNTNRLSKGVRVFMPLGGGLIYFADDLLKRFDAIPEEPDSGELRLYIPPSRLSEFRLWFLSQRDRETDPFRELEEELIDETGALPKLERADVEFQRLYIHDSERITDRKGVEGAKTQYWLEIFDVSFNSPDVWKRLIELPPDSYLRWVTSEAIRVGVTPEGEAVEARTILEQS